VPAQWFSLRYGAYSRWVLTALAMGPARSGIALGGSDVSIAMGWGITGRAPISSIVSATPVDDTVALARGVHGWRGRWLVNGAGYGLVEVRFEPRMKAHVVGFPVRIRTLLVSVENPEGFALALRAAAGV
jgi:hypothetical protein